MTKVRTKPNTHWECCNAFYAFASAPCSALSYIMPGRRVGSAGGVYRRSQNSGGPSAHRCEREQCTLPLSLSQGCTVVYRTVLQAKYNRNTCGSASTHCEKTQNALPPTNHHHPPYPPCLRRRHVRCGSQRFPMTRRRAEQLRRDSFGVNLSQQICKWTKLIVTAGPTFRRLL
jgi:hypothetical protein